MPYILADTENARNHVRSIESKGRTHSLTGCPPFCRAICPHAVYVVDDEPLDKYALNLDEGVPD